MVSHAPPHKLRWNSSWVPGFWRKSGTISPQLRRGGADDGVAKRAPSQMSCLGWVDVHAGDKVDARVEEVGEDGVAHADGSFDH